MMRKLIFSLCFVAVPVIASAQTSDGGFGEIASMSMASVTKSMHAIIRRNLVEAAEKVPAADYAFKPTPDVRSFGQLIGHLANGNFYFCSQAKGEASPSKENFERATDKDAIVKGLNGFARVLRQRLQRDDRHQLQSSDESGCTRWQHCPGIARLCAHIQHDAQQRALRQRHRLHATQRARSTVDGSRAEEVSSIASLQE